jgi:integrase
MRSWRARGCVSWLAPADAAGWEAQMVTKSGGRPATGSIVWADPETKTKPIGVRVTKANGKRKLVPFEPGTTADDARALAPELAERGRFAVGEHEGETVTEYAKRWCEWREGSGLACVEDDRARLLCHVLPVIGTRGIVDVTRDDLKRLVTTLDARARRGFREGTDGRRKSFGWKSAVHAWTVVRAMFRDACRAKRVDLCVRDDNPAAGVAAPDAGTRKAKTYLWPSEFLALVSSPSVPVRWRRLIALAVCTYARAGELAALEWDGIDLEHGTIHVHRARSSKGERSLKPTKTDTARRIPIEPSLLPLLRAMHAEEKGRGDAPTGALVCMPASGQLSAKLKVYLRRAGITRADLFTSDETRKAITFHDLRATGITWCAVRGDDALKIKQRAGHASFSTTEGYIREAENMRAGFGAVFPALPAGLLKRGPVRPTPNRRPEVSAAVSAFGVAGSTKQGKTRLIRSGRRDLNPRRRAPKARALPDCATPRGTRDL